MGNRTPGTPVRIAVDGMGGDEAPDAVVVGAIDAARLYGDRLSPILVGDKPRLQAAVARHKGLDVDLEIVHAEQQVEMGEAGAGAFRKKRDSSMAIATRMVRDGAACGVFSAGNTGAMVATALLNMGRLPGVSRPAIATLIPTSGNQRWAILLDVGATADCKPLHLYHFAVLGEHYARILLEIEKPRVALLNIGEEASKGTELAQGAHALMARRENFVGNVEGRDILKGHADVVVADGFTGNVMLKFAESVWAWTVSLVRTELGEHILAKAGAFLLKPSFKRIRARMDYSEYGGAPLLGVNGTCIIGHGSSTPKAICNGIRFAADLVESGLNDEIRSELEREQGGQVVGT